MVHAFAGNLLMTTGSYEDAMKAFTNADSVQHCAFAIYQRARCQLAIGDIEGASQDLLQANNMYNQNSDFHENKMHQNPIVLRDNICLHQLVESMHLLQE